MNSFISTLLVYMRELSKCSECGRIKSRKVKTFLADNAHGEVDHVLGQGGVPSVPAALIIAVTKAVSGTGDFWLTV